MPRLKLAGNTKKKKKCVKGFPCGYSCQNKDKTCRNPLGKKQAATYQEYLKTQSERLAKIEGYLEVRKGRNNNKKPYETKFAEFVRQSDYQKQQSFGQDHWTEQLGEYLYQKGTKAQRGKGVVVASKSAIQRWMKSNTSGNYGDLEVLSKNNRFAFSGLGDSYQITDRARIQHANKIELAIADGESIPTDVLRDYPHLRNGTGEGKPSITTQGATMTLSSGKKDTHTDQSTKEDWQMTKSEYDKKKRDEWKQRPDFDDYVITSDGFTGVLRGSGGIGSERVKVVNSNGSSRYANRSDLKVIRKHGRFHEDQAKSDLANQWLDGVVQDVAKLEQDHKDILARRSLRDSFKTKYRQRQTTKSQLEDLLAKYPQSQEDEQKALEILDQIAKIKNREIPKVKTDHETLVERAIVQGKPVPEEVLRDYPHLRKTKSTQPQKPKNYWDEGYQGEMNPTQKQVQRAISAISNLSSKKRSDQPFIEQNTQIVRQRISELESSIQAYKTSSGKENPKVKERISNAESELEGLKKLAQDRRFSTDQPNPSSAKNYWDEGYEHDNSKGVLNPAQVTVQKSAYVLKNAQKGSEPRQKAVTNILERIGILEDAVKRNSQGKSANQPYMKERIERDKSEALGLRDLLKEHGESVDIPSDIPSVKTTASGAILPTSQIKIDGDNFKRGKKQESKPETPTQSNPQKTLSLSSLEAFTSRLRSGNTTTEEIKQTWEQFKQQEDLITQELGKMTKQQLAKYQGWGTRPSDPKKHFVSGAVNYFKTQFQPGESFSWSPMSETMTQAIDRQMEKWTDETVKAKAQRYQDAIEARKARIEGIKNPQTLSELRDREDVMGKDSLTTEQKREKDRLTAEQSKERKQSDRERKLTQLGTVSELPDGVSLAYEVKKHTKTGEDLHTVGLTDRVDRDVYNALNQRAKQYNGYYSKFAKGFLFKTEEDAQSFANLKNTPNTQEIIQDKDAEKRQSASERIRSQASRMQETADETLNADRKVNTARRASMASNIEDRAREQKAMAQTMENIADAIENNDVKFIDRMSTKADFEMMEGLLRDAKYERLNRQQREKGYHTTSDDDWRRSPTIEDIDDFGVFSPSFHDDALMRWARTLDKKKGYKQVAQRLQKAAQSRTPDQLGRIPYSNLDDLKKAYQGLKGTGEGWQLEKTVENLKRLERMGITTDAELRSAMREYHQYRKGKAQESPITKMERELIGTKIPGYFPTPQPLADKVANLADIRDGQSVLEPSAGKGSLVEAVQRTGKQTDIVTAEINSTLRGILKAKGLNPEPDFLEMSPKDKQFDRIVMNPPFENQQDIDHVRHAYDLLKPGGRIVAIVSESPFFNSNKKASEFRDWLDGKGYSEKLPEGSFKDSDRSTGVNTRLVVIDKPDKANFSESRRRFKMDLRPFHLFQRGVNHGYTHTVVSR